MKFANLQAKLNGTFRTWSFWNPNNKDFTAILNNITYEQSFNVAVTKEQNGTKTFKYKKIGETELSYKVQSFNFTSDFSNKELYLSMGKSGIRNLNFKEFRYLLSKIQTIILDYVATELSK